MEICSKDIHSKNVTQKGNTWSRTNSSRNVGGLRFREQGKQHGKYPEETKVKTGKGLMRLRTQVREEICNILSELSQSKRNASKLAKTAEPHFKQQSRCTIKKAYSLIVRVSNKVTRILDWKS